MEISRRFQQLFHLIVVIPGASSCFRSDVFKQLDLGKGSLTEDFDITMQMHRQKIGRIQFIREAKVFTQDPKNTADFLQQINRWYRGFFQVAKLHRVPFGGGIADLYFSHQFMQVITVLIWYFVIVPIFAFVLGSPAILALVFLTDVLMMFGAVLTSGILAGRPEIIRSFPFILLYRWLNFFSFVIAFFDVMILNKLPLRSKVTWGTNDRRYQSKVTN